MTKSISRSQVRLIASTNAIFGADEACAVSATLKVNASLSNI